MKEKTGLTIKTSNIYKLDMYQDRHIRYCRKIRDLVKSKLGGKEQAMLEVYANSGFDSQFASDCSFLEAAYTSANHENEKELGNFSPETEDRSCPSYSLIHGYFRQVFDKPAVRDYFDEHLQTCPRCKQKIHDEPWAYEQPDRMGETEPNIDVILKISKITEDSADE